MRHKFLKRNKYGAKKTIRDGICFDSIKEADYYENLKIRMAAGEVVMFLRQVPFDLPGGIKYRVDFQEFLENGTVRFVDVKGVKTKDFIMKKKMVEYIYPVEIEIA